MYRARAPAGVRGKAEGCHEDGAWLDIAANGVWGGRIEKTYFDVRVYNPPAQSNRHRTMRKHEREKKRAYEQRIREIEHATFRSSCGHAIIKMPTAQ